MKEKILPKGRNLLLHLLGCGRRCQSVDDAEGSPPPLSILIALNKTVWSWLAWELNRQNDPLLVFTSQPADWP